MFNFSSIWKWIIIFFLTGGFLHFVANTGFSAPFPQYQINVEYLPSQKLLKGKAEITYSETHYPHDHLLFALPINRYSEPDSRGPRKILQTPVFALDAFKKIEDDPLFPNGFSPSKTLIRSVHDLQGNSLHYQIIENPDIVVGFSRKKGLLRVDLKEPLSQSTVVIGFETKLPERFQEGLVETELLTVKWHPQLLQIDQNTWRTDLMEPAPGNYRVSWKSQQSGTLIVTTGVYPYESNQTIALAPSQRPLKYFPLIFSPHYHRTNALPNASVQSFYLGSEKRRSLLLQKWGDEFLKFVQAHYALPLPWKQIYIVETHGNHEQIAVKNNIILITAPHYKRTALFDRRVLAFFTRGLGELWFGETVWHNKDHQLWLSRGLSTFLGLKFYAYKYGADAGIFNFIDWINPRYREHFIENMARNIRQDLQQPIISSIQENTKHSETRILLRLVTYKAALVVSMLEYLVQKKAFQQGLHHFYTENRYEVTTEANLQKSMERYHDEDLDWFFKQWFHTTQTLDYGIGTVNENMLPDGRYETKVTIEQLASAKMPIEVQLTTEHGTIHRQRTKMREKQEIVTFITENPADQVSLDPDEWLLELERINNHTQTFLRIRPAFDWKKQREVMSLLIPRVGSNAIDGNQIGLQSKNSFSQKYALQATAGYGTKNKQFLYTLQFERRKLFRDNINARLSFSQIGGIISRELSLSYTSPYRKEKFAYSVTIEIDQETVYKTKPKEKTRSSSPVETGDTSNLALVHTGQIGFKNLYFPAWSIRVEQPLIDLGADFTYILLSTHIIHLFNVGFQKRIYWTWLYGTTDGASPLQKKHQLGSPRVLRGYPQRTILRDDQLLASRLDYEFPLISRPWWGNISSLGVQGIVFFDIGKVWGNNESFEEAKQRQDAGIGVKWSVDTVALFQFPLKVEVAYPLGDSEFEKPQFVLAGAVSFF